MLPLRKLEDIIGADGDRFDEIKKRNRDALRDGPDWCRPEELKKSFWRYGVGAPSEPGLNVIPDEATYCDLVQYLAGRLTKKINYLEIGVSVGKSVFQHARAWSDAHMAAVDIEEISSPLREGLGVPADAQPEPWGIVQIFHQGKNPKVKCPSTLRWNTPLNSEFLYHSVDKFKEDLWKRLGDRQFNVVFSDAFHQPESILHEFAALVNNDLIDRDEFVLIWDDITENMEGALRQIASALGTLYGINRVDTALLPILGTYGGPTGKGVHRIGVITKYREGKLIA